MTGAADHDPRLRDVATELYALRPSEFTAARTTAEKQARADGDRALAAAIKGLRRPSVAAWAVNRLVRERQELVQQVVALGASLREAQAHLEGQALRDLGRQRRQLVTAVTSEARAVAAEEGEALSDAAARQVEETLQAAMTDASAASAVLTGLLTQPLSSTGLATVGELLAVPGLADAAEPDDAERTRGKAAGRGAGGAGLRLVPEPEEPDEDKQAREEAARAAARRAAEERVARAGSAVRTATAALEAVQKKRRKRQARVLQLENELEELRRRVAELEETTDEAAERLTEVETRVQEAEAEVADARAEADAAQEALDRLE